MSFKKYIWERFKKSFSLNKIYKELKDFILIFIMSFVIFFIFFGAPMIIAFILGVVGLHLM